MIITPTLGKWPSQVNTSDAGALRSGPSAHGREPPKGAAPGEPASKLRAMQPNDPARALGLAVSYLMTKPAFARLTFGHWSRVLVGQINRRHFLFIMQGDKPVGFAGWSFAPRDKAEDWLMGRRDLPYADSLAGEIFVFNAWEASTLGVHRFLVDEMRPYFQDKEMIYYKRLYNDGRVRPVRLTVNQFVKAHIERKTLEDASK